MKRTTFVSVALAAVVLLCAAIPADALPAGNYCVGHKLGPTGQHLRARLVIVDGTGATGCDVRDIGTANAYVTAQTRGAAAQWTVYLKSGANNTTYNYTETSGAVPSWTTIIGPSAANPPILRLTGLTGTLWSMGTGSALQNLAITAGGTAASTGAVKVVATTGTSASLTDVSISVGSTFGDAQVVDLVSNGAGALTLTRVNLSKAGTSTLSRLLVNGAAGTSIVADGGTWTAGTSQAKAAENLNAAGTFAVYGIKIATAATADLAGTTGPITYANMAPPTNSGTVTGAAAPSATTATALAANGANCSAGSAPLGVNASGAAESCTAYQAAQVAMPVNANDACVAGTFAVDASFAAFCVATNTWVRVAVATWP